MIYLKDGSYFEIYEIFNNYVVHTASFHDGYLKPISNEVFLIRQLYMYIQHALPNLPINELAHIITLYIGLFTLTLSIYNVIKHKTLKWLAIIILYLLFAEDIIIINTSRISFICGIASLSFLMTDFKWKKIIFYLLAILSIFNRVEVGIVIFTLGTLIFLLDSSMRKMILHTSIAMFFGVLCMMTFKFYNAKFCPYVDAFSNVERKFLHHNNFIFSITDLIDIINGKESDTTKLKKFANSLFIMDEPTIRYQDVTENLNQTSFVKFVINDTQQFLAFYAKSLKTLLDHYSKYIYVIIASVIILLMGLKNSMRHRKKFIKHSIIIAAFFFIPVIISLNVSISERFISPYISSIIIISLIYLLKNNAIKDDKKFIGVILIMSSLYLNYNNQIQPEISSYLEREKISKIILDDHHKDYLAGDKPMFIYLIGTMFLPGKLFNTENERYSEYRFLSLCAIDQTEYFKNINNKIYGDEYKSLAKRMTYLKEHTKYVYANPYEISFLENYIRKVHGLDIRFQIVNTYDDYQKNRSLKIYKYKVLTS